MPKERISNKVEVVNFVCVSLENFIDLTFDNLCMEDSSFEFYGIAEIHFAVIDEVMSAYERFDSLLHCFDIEVVFGKKVFIRTLSTPITSIEILLNLLTSQDSNILRQKRIEHRTKIYFLVLVVRFWMKKLI